LPFLPDPPLLFLYAADIDEEEDEEGPSKEE
jgi:hypothetical protein